MLAAIACPPPRATHQRQTAGAACNPSADDAAKALITTAPIKGVLANPATTKADCSSPQGQATHRPPANAAPKVPREARRVIGCATPPPGAVLLSGLGRPRAVTQSGCWPVAASHKPKASAAMCRRPHSGRITGAA